MWPLGLSPSYSEYRFFYNFNKEATSNIVIRTDTMSTGYYTSSYCDAHGNIVMYSNGVWILNKWGELVENSMGLNPTLPDWQNYNYRGGQSGFFLAHPRDSTILYFISLDFGPHPVHLWPYWFVGQNLMVATIDLAANNGAGKVIQKNQVLLSGTLMSPAACRHANGRDWWILVSDADENFHYRVLLNPEGFSTPDTQAIGTKPNPIPYEGGKSNFIVGNCFSPSGKYYVDCNENLGFSIFSFDRCSGLLSSERRVDYPPPSSFYPNYYRNSPGSGAVFSSDDRFFYKTTTYGVAFAPALPLGTMPYLLQYDLSAPDISTQVDTINTIDSADYHYPENITWDGFYGAELGPDGRIYVVHEGVSYCTVQYPNVRGRDCKFIHNSPDFGVVIGSAIPYMPSYRLGPLDGSPCDTLGINNVPVAHFRVDDTLGALHRYFYDLSHHEPATWHWDFGDGATSEDTSALHTFPGPGLYTVCLTVSNGYGSTTTCTNVWVGITGSTNPATTVENLQIIPNPFRGQLHIILPTVLTDAVFRLYDQLGYLVAEENIASTANQITTEALPPGVYFWEVQVQGKRAGTGKVVKMGRD